MPDAGSKTIANGDLVAVCVQMTARGGVDSRSGLSVGQQAQIACIVQLIRIIGATYTR